MHQHAGVAPPVGAAVIIPSPGAALPRDGFLVEIMAGDATVAAKAFNDRRDALYYASWYCWPKPDHVARITASCEGAAVSVETLSFP